MCNIVLGMDLMTQVGVHVDTAQKVIQRGVLSAPRPPLNNLVINDIHDCTNRWHLLVLAVICDCEFHNAGIMHHTVLMWLVMITCEVCNPSTDDWQQTCNCLVPIQSVGANEAGNATIAMSVAMKQ